MLHGCLDAITSSGYVEGWAYDTDTPLQPLTVSIVADGVERAQGLANRYRADLADAGCGTGWCAFRLRLSGSVTRLRRIGVSLREATSQVEIDSVPGLTLAEDHEPGLTALDQVFRADPTLILSIDQLRGCGALFADFIAARGVEAFVRAAYVYVLGRPADESGLAAYSALLREGALAPYDLLRILHDSDEFRAGPRLLLAPPEPGFGFHAA